MGNSFDQMQENGRVLRTRGAFAEVETTQSEACGHCSAKGACMAMGGERKRLIDALNKAGAQPGDLVRLALPTGSVLRASFIVYLIPALSLIAGAALGNFYGPRWGWNPEPAAIWMGFLSLLFCLLILRRVSKSLEGNRRYTVIIDKVLQKGELDAVEQCPSGV